MDATTLNLPTPAARNGDRAALAFAVAEYLAAGGEVITLSGFEVKPLPARREPEPSPKPQALRRRDVGNIMFSFHGAPVIRNHEQVEKARKEREKLAKVIAQYAHRGCSMCAAMTGASATHIRAVAREFGIVLGRPN